MNHVQSWQFRTKQNKNSDCRFEWIFDELYPALEVNNTDTNTTIKCKLVYELEVNRVCLLSERSREKVCIAVYTKCLKAL